LLTPRPVLLALSTGQVRVASVLTYAALATGYGLPLVGAAPELARGCDVAKLIGLFGCLALFMTRLSFLANAPRSALDERERIVQGQIYLPAFAIMVSALFALVGGLEVARLAGGAAPAVESLRDALCGLAIGAVALPATILAWRTPPEPSTDD
jgi:hypothetical protein